MNRWIGSAACLRLAHHLLLGVDGRAEHKRGRILYSSLVLDQLVDNIVGGLVSSAAMLGEIEERRHRMLVHTAIS